MKDLCTEKKYKKKKKKRNQVNEKFYLHILCRPKRFTDCTQIPRLKGSLQIIFSCSVSMRPY